jgi:lipopolysaccharide/colanic/teichoic acid biosynthesis glycosyltransferase
MNAPRQELKAQRTGHRTLISRKRFQIASALVVAVLIPWLFRSLLPEKQFAAAAANTLIANAVSVAIAFWMRFSVETYPGIRRSYVILPSALTGHGLVLVWFLMTRFPYDRLALVLGFLLHISWLYFLYVYGETRGARQIAVVPFGRVESLFRIEGVVWHKLGRPNLREARHCDAIVADFSSELPDEWESFLADAALAGRIVFQHKQLAESLTGRVELEHLSENSFGSLVPAMGYFHLKTLIDVAFAVAVLPFLLPIMAVIAIAIRLDSPGPVLFRQKRVGYAGKSIIAYKFRSMRPCTDLDDRSAAMTKDDDDRITDVGRVIRKLRLDELPQIWNVLKLQMSWIGPRPEAEILSTWYTNEIPFYRYRHVVKPGISGWAQVNQGHVAEVQQVHRKLQYDFYYIKYFSPWLDLLIFVRTIKTMLTGFGSR